MALIKCPECGTEVSDKAMTCPKCAYPIQKPKEEREVVFSFDKAAGQVFNTGCKVFDMNGRELVSCRQGDTVSIDCEKPMTVQIKMSGCFGKPTAEIEPGGKYQVSITGMGKVRVQKVSVIRPPQEANYWGSI